MQVHVFDSDQKPLAGARITVRGMTSLPFGPVRYRTDTQGNALIAAPKKDVKNYQILVMKNDYVTVGAAWHGDGVQALVPEKFTFTLAQGTAFGGIVRDEQGQPIAGAEVTVDGRKTSPDTPLWVSIYDIVKSDAKGKWRVHRIPKDLAGFDLQVTIKRPDVAGIERFDRKALPIDKLRGQTAVFILRKGIALEGIVTDPQGKPAAGATVGLFPELSGGDFPRTKTDPSGRYRFAVTEPGEYTLAAAAKGDAPDSHRITIGTQPQKVDLQLRKGEMIRLRVIDKQGKPMPGVVVSTVFNNAYHEALMLDYESSIERDHDRHMVADAKGRWSRLWIPKDVLTLLISKPGYAQVERKIAPGGQEQVITLEAGGWSIAGRVVDRATKAPVTKFRVTEGLSGVGWGDVVLWYQSRPVSNENGQYRATWDRPDDRRVIRIEADGYFPSGPSPQKGKQVTFDVELRKGEDITGVVRLPDGRPAANADVVLCTAGRGLYLRNGRAALDQFPLLARTKTDGRFSFPPEVDPYLLVAIHDQGFAQVEDRGAMKAITLQPWARAEGTLRIGNKPGARESIKIDFDDLWTHSPENFSPSQQAARRISNDYQAQTDAEGHFVFERVRPGKAKISRFVKLSQEGMMSSWTAADNKSVELLPGQTVTVTLAGNDSSVIRQRAGHRKVARDCSAP